MKKVTTIFLCVLMLAALSGSKAEAASGIKAGDVIPFGAYSWRALDVQDGKALLLCEFALGAGEYNEEYTAVTWETCTLRLFLNEGFYNEFSAEEKARIAETMLSNNDNPLFGTSGGNDTNDKIFLLSIEEVEKYFGGSGQLDNSALIAMSSNGAASAWWLRSPGVGETSAVSVSEDGEFDFYGEVDSMSKDIRPALWLIL